MRKGEIRPLSANERGKGRAIWELARVAAAPLVALVLGGAAMALILTSGNGLLPPHLRPIGIGGGGPGSSSATPPPAKVVVTSPPLATHTHHRSVIPTRPSRSAPTTGAVAPAQGHAKAHPVSRSTHHSPQAGGHHKPPTTSGGGGPTTPTPTTPTPTTPTPTTPTPTTPTPTQPPPKMGGNDDQEKGSSGHGRGTPRGRAVGHRDHFPPGQACKSHHSPPCGRAVGYRHDVPPGHAKHDQHAAPSHEGDDDQGSDQGNGNHAPSGHAHHVPPGQARKEDPPRPSHSHGHSHGDEGHGSHGQGHDH